MALAIRKQIEAVEATQSRPGIGTEVGQERAFQLLAAGRIQEATRLYESVSDSITDGWDWSCLDSLAAGYLQLGYADRARQLWARIRTVPSEQIRALRIAGTHWIEGDLATAVRLYSNARAAKLDSAESCWALAWLYAELGDADLAEEEIRRAPDALPPALRAELDNLRRLLIPYRTEPRKH
jgi:tetratricopeptide (TPR) repeat protein